MTDEITEQSVDGTGRYQYHVGIGNETFDTRHEAVGQLAIYLRDDPFTNPMFAASRVQVLTPNDALDDVDLLRVQPCGCRVGVQAFNAQFEGSEKA